jgi:uncharacterized protein YndB with AHSA1/START domain
MSSTETAVEPVRRTITVNRPVEDAFRVFTDGIASWWPLESHSIEAMGPDGARVPETVVLEGRAGGRLYERTSAGEEGYWGTVTHWEPPHRVVIAWKVNPDAAAPTEIDVRFAADGAGTRVELEHRGWERLGASAGEARASYASGWVTVLGAYERVANDAS